MCIPLWFVVSSFSNKSLKFDEITSIPNKPSPKFFILTPLVIKVMFKVKDLNQIGKIGVSH